MTPFMNPGTARACMALGALGAACTLTMDAHAATPADATPTPTSAPAKVQFGPWVADRAQLRSSAFNLPSRRVARRVARVDPIAAAIRRMVAAGDRIARTPYVYGGGHGSFTSGGYDCSGSVSYVLGGAGLLSAPEDSSGLESFGDPGPGRHVTIYANGGHAFMTIDGRRFDTIALQETGTRWSASIGSTDGYVVRHPRGF